VAQFPWWRLATAVLLIVALVIALDAGRVIEAVVLGVLAFASLALLVLSLLAWTRSAQYGTTARPTPVTRKVKSRGSDASQRLLDPMGVDGVCVRLSLPLAGRTEKACRVHGRVPVMGT
jgi:hypothetical protein